LAQSRIGWPRALGPRRQGIGGGTGGAVLAATPRGEVAHGLCI